MSRWFKISFLALCMMAVGMMSTAARADVTYTFTGVNNANGGDDQTVAFSFTTSNFVTSLTSLMSSQLTSCTHCETIASVPSVYLAPNVPYFGDGLQFNDNLNNGSVYMFTAGALDTVGTYYSSGLFNSGKLVVSTSTTAVPEPGTVTMTAAAGLMLASVVLFRRKETAVADIA